MRVALRIAAVLATVHVGIAFFGAMYAMTRSAAGDTARQVGAISAIAVLGAVCFFGVVQLWRLKRSGLVIVGAMYLLVLTMQSIWLVQGKGGWAGLAMVTAMLALLWLPPAWRCVSKASQPLTSQASGGSRQASRT